MKIIERTILPFQEVNFLSPIRDKIDYVRVVAFAARQLLLSNVDAVGVETKCHMKLVIDKMSRLFFYTENKYFSVSFPLTVSTDDENEVTDLTTYSGRRIDNQVISAIISVIDNPGFRTDISFINFYIDQDGSDQADLHLLEELFRFEPSYIRYDCDPENVNGNFHPLHHLDINYSQYGTFKLGLSREIEQDYFESLQNIRTECIFLRD